MPVVSQKSTPPAPTDAISGTKGCAHSPVTSPPYGACITCSWRCVELGVRVSGYRYQVSGFEFRALALRMSCVLSIGFNVSDFGHQVSGIWFQLSAIWPCRWRGCCLSFGIWILVVIFRVSGIEFRVWSFRHLASRMVGVLSFGFKVSGFGHVVSGIKFRVSDFGHSPRGWRGC